MADQIPGLYLTLEDCVNKFETPQLNSNGWTSPASARSLDSLFESPPQSADDSTESHSQPLTSNNVSIYSEDRSAVGNGNQASMPDQSAPIASTSQTYEHTTTLNRLDTASAKDPRLILLHGKEYLSDLTPDSVQSHHPSIIPRSPNRNASRTHSMIEIARQETEAVTQPLTREALATKERETSAGRPTLSARIATDDSSSFRKPLSAASQSRTFTVKTQLGSIDAISHRAVHDAPATGDSPFASRPDTPRPCYNSIENGYQSQAQMWREEPGSIRSDTPSPTTHAGSIRHSGAETEIPPVGSNYDLERDPQPCLYAAAEQNITNEHEPAWQSWEEPEPVNDVLNEQPSSSPSPSPLNGPRYAWHPTHLSNQPQESFRTNAIEIDMSVSGSNSLGPNQIVVVKRGRQAESQPDQVELSRGRMAVSQARKSRVTSRPKPKTNAQLGVQGQGSKIRKRSVSRARSASRTLPRSRGNPKADDVPAIPDNMDSDQQCPQSSTEPAPAKTSAARSKKGIARSNRSTPSRSGRESTPKSKVVSTPEALAMLEHDNQTSETSPKDSPQTLRSSPRLKRESNPASISPTVRKTRKTPAKPKGITKGKPQSRKTSRRTVKGAPET